CGLGGCGVPGGAGQGKRDGYMEDGTQRQGDAAAGLHQMRGEKPVSFRKVESTFSTSFPFASLAALTCFHSGSARKLAQFAVAASRLG
ncbi:MAG: hypothetical protein M3O02_02935, partial [Acidobacteriota bacterium]|nr:hypothetical protein [Acidobacteriota bacterium]